MSTPKPTLSYDHSQGEAREKGPDPLKSGCSLDTEDRHERVTGEGLYLLSMYLFYQTYQ